MFIYRHNVMVGVWMIPLHVGGEEGAARQVGGAAGGGGKRRVWVGGVSGGRWAVLAGVVAAGGLGPE